MQNERSGARKHHRAGKEGEVLSPLEAAAVARGQSLKRYVRAAAAMQGIFDDVTLGEAAGVNRGAVAGWWRGARPSPDTLRSLARAAGLEVDELAAFIYYDGPPPRLPHSVEAEAQERADAAERSRHARPEVEGSEAQRAPHERAGSAQ